MNIYKTDDKSKPFKVEATPTIQLPWSYFGGTYLPEQKILMFGGLVTTTRNS